MAPDRELELALEFSELERAKRTVVEIKTNLDSIKDIRTGAVNVEGIHSLVAGWNVLCDLRLSELRRTLKIPQPVPAAEAQET
ncbi:MAG: hypothetical protein ABI643_00910 [Candidatus Doudnabacteria bacterium]